MKFFLDLLRFCVVCITLTAVAHFQNSHIGSLAANVRAVCNTAECKRLGTLYRQYMDTSKQPCTDFYDYVCHNWGTYHPKPVDINSAVSWDVDTSLDYRALQNVRDLLENKNASTSVDLERAKRMYRMCMNIHIDSTETTRGVPLPRWPRPDTLIPDTYIKRPLPPPAFLPKLNASDLRNIMKKIGEFPLLLAGNAQVPSNVSLWQIHQRYLELTGESSLFNFNIAYNPLNPSEVITELKQLSSPYGAISHNLGWSKLDELKYYKAFLNDVLQSLVEKNYKISKQCGHDIMDVIKFRDTLNMHIAMKDFAPHENRIMTIKEFQNWYDGEPKSEDIVDANWLGMIRTIHKNPSDPHSPTITENAKLNVESNYISRLVQFLGKTPKKVIVNHIHLYFAERHMERNSQMQAHLQQSVTDLGASRNGEIRIENRWRKCIESLDGKNVLENVYLSTYFQKQDKLRTQELFDTSKNLLEQMILESIWLSSSVKKGLIDKARKIKGLMGYSDSDTSKELRVDAEMVKPVQAIARYSNRLNEVYTSAAYLQWPVYSPNLPYVIEYGATISVFGHELYHAFDQDGIKCTEQGYVSCRPQEMIREYNNRIKCFKDQFKKFKLIEMKRLKLRTPYDIVFDKTVDEDMADAMGLKLAYRGFQQMLQKTKGVCPILPGMETADCEKLFFIAFANGMCSSLSPRQEATAAFEDTHNLPRIRVNGAVANMKEFSEAFRCNINDPLYLNQSCDLWK